jgi:hypothetical protein
MSGTFSSYVTNGASGLPPITAALCRTWNANSQAVAEYGPTPTATGVSAVIDAVYALETAVATLTPAVTALQDGG